MSGNPLHEIHNVTHGGPWPKKRPHAGCFECRKIFVGNDPAAEQDDVLGPLFFEQLQHAPEERIVRAGEDAQADRIHILLNRCADDLLRRLVETGVDHFRAGVTQARAQSSFTPRSWPSSPTLPIKTRIGVAATPMLSPHGENIYLPDPCGHARPGPTDHAQRTTAISLRRLGPRPIVLSRASEWGTGRSP